MSLEAKPIHDELASRRPASDNRQGSGCGGMTLQNHASNPPAAAQWKQDACNLYREPRPPMARPRVPSDWPPQSLQRSRQKQDACASILPRTAAACGMAAGPVLHAWLTGRLRQGRRCAKEHPASAHSLLSQQGSRPVQEHLDSCRNQADFHRLSPRHL